MAASAIVETDDAPSMSSKRRTEPAAIIEASNAAAARLVRKACRAVLDGAPEVSDVFATDIAVPTDSAAATTTATVEAEGAPSSAASLWSDPDDVCEPPVASADRPSAVASPSASPAGFSVVASRSGAGGGSCWTTGGSPAGGVTSGAGGVCSAGGGLAAAGGVSSGGGGGGGGASAGGGVCSGGGGLSATGGVSSAGGGLSSAGGGLSTAGGVSSGGGTLSAAGGCSCPPGGGVGSAVGTASSEPEETCSVAGGACSPASASVVASGEFVSSARASPTKRPTNRREPASASDATSRRAIERPSEGASSGGFSSSVIMKRSQGSVGYRHIRS